MGMIKICEREILDIVNILEEFKEYLCEQNEHPSLRDDEIETHSLEYCIDILIKETRYSINEKLDCKNVKFLDKLRIAFKFIFKK